jgi:predicted RNA-binding protein with PUA-like domain
MPMPLYWLLKTEPDEYSFDQLVADRRTVWDGVSNNLALQHIRKMKIGDKVLIYHTGKERAVVGIAEVITNPYPDLNLNDKKRVVVNIKPDRKLPYPVSLAEIKSNQTFKDFDMVKIPRLSVMPLKDIYWNTILSMGGL